jgi:hypothetical protein
MIRHCDADTGGSVLEVTGCRVRAAQTPLPKKLCELAAQKRRLPAASNDPPCEEEHSADGPTALALEPDDAGADRGNGRKRPPRRVPPPLPKSASEPETIPVIVPPVPLAMRCDPRRLRRAWLFRCLRQGPSWLLSCLVHLTVFIVLASLVVPLSQQNPVASLIFRFAEAEGLEEETQSIEDVVVVFDIKALEDLQQPTFDTQGDSSVAQPTEDGTSDGENKAQEESEKDPDPPDRKLASVDRGPIPILLDPAALAPQGLPSSIPEEYSPERVRVNEIVDQFILYDIGELKAEEGETANRNFRALGPDAIPSLVYGLNKAAGYRQSCPVGVISNKLDNALQQSTDPAMIAYALDNVGRGVPDNAPHASRIQACKRRWAAQAFKQRTVIAAALQARGLPPDEDLIEQVGDLTYASQAEVDVALRDASQRTRIAAVVALSQRGRAGISGGSTAAGRSVSDGLSDTDPVVRQLAHRVLVDLANGDDLGEDAQAWGEYWDIEEHARQLAGASHHSILAALNHSDWHKRRGAACAVAAEKEAFADTHRVALAKRLMYLLENDQVQVQRASQKALVTLADGESAGRAPPAEGPASPELARQWRDYWERFEQQRVVEPHTKSLLAMAETLEGHGLQKQAAARYQRIVEEYPDSRAADEARRRLRGRRWDN